MSMGTWWQPTDANGKPRLDKDGKPTPGRGYLCAPVGRASGLASRGWFNLATGWGSGTIHVWFIGTTADGRPEYLFDEQKNLVDNVRLNWGMPDGTDQISVAFTLDDPTQPLGWSVEMEAR